MAEPVRGVAVVTGASAGIGAATAERLAAEGFDVVLGARRTDRLTEVASRCGPSARAMALDVADPASVRAFCEAIDECRILVNNAGGALGLEPVATADLGRWQRMYDVNVLGSVRMVQALLPALVASGDGHVINVGSIAGIEPYVGGAGYNAAKAAVHALTDVLRKETVDVPVRVSEVLPGLVETEFSLVRFDGDADRAAAVYEGLTPLSADDVADVIAFVATRPAHVNLASVLVLPTDQASVGVVHRRR